MFTIFIYVIATADISSSSGSLPSVLPPHSHIIMALLFATHAEFIVHRVRNFRSSTIHILKKRGVKEGKWNYSTRAFNKVNTEYVRYPCTECKKGVRSYTVLRLLWIACTRAWPLK